MEFPLNEHLWSAHGPSAVVYHALRNFFYYVSKYIDGKSQDKTFQYISYNAEASLSETLKYLQFQLRQYQDVRPPQLTASMKQSQ